MKSGKKIDHVKETSRDHHQSYFKEQFPAACLERVQRSSSEIVTTQFWSITTLGFQRDVKKRNPFGKWSWTTMVGEVSKEIARVNHERARTPSKSRVQALTPKVINT